LAARGVRERHPGVKSASKNPDGDERAATTSPDERISTSNGGGRVDCLLSFWSFEF